MRLNRLQNDKLLRLKSNCLYNATSIGEIGGSHWNQAWIVPSANATMYIGNTYYASKIDVMFVANSIWAPSSEFMSSSILSWQILTAHAQPFRGVRDLAFCLKVPLDSMLVWASSEGSGETARMRRLAWTFAARIGDKYQIRLTRPIWLFRCSKKLSTPMYTIPLNQCTPVKWTRKVWS